MNAIYVIGTEQRKKIYSMQFGWVEPSDNHHIISSLIYGRPAAEETLRQLQALPCSETKQLQIFPVDLHVRMEGLS